MRDPIEDLPPLREVIRANELDAKKSLGQNFLFDLNLTGRIARAAMPLEGTVIEIGPGPGGLTRALLLAGAERVIAIEKDRRAIAALAPLVKAAEGRLEIIEADALTVDMASLGPQGERRQIVANLPYNIATGLLLGWLDKLDHLDAMTLMFQREVGQRIVAPPGSSQYGRLAVMCQWMCETRMVFDIPPQAFVPPPKVTSSVVQLFPRETPLAVADKTCLEDVTRALFGQRRKMLRSSIKTLKTDGLMEGLELTGNERPETLAVEDFCAIAEALRKARA
ncbi:MAG: 16S rRNA (adenine(1518)-N(6)/adenine(1519)-N(6))-dimethyltransferase RsmA [Alphaproteobacteria bacterium]|nr:16S rRNA (adenine(1518)-N(6)/adenine(1519)-N(6))-dimethyltransferase RsmA [Alphaproteobacteria bacterium]